MSITAKLDVFTLKVREKGNRENYLKLNDIAGFNFIDEISNYLGKNIYLFKIDNSAERTSRIEKNELADCSLFCRIKVGKFGESSEIVDTLSGSGIFHKEKEHSDTIPLFFHMKVDSDNSEAVFHIERSGNRTLLPEIRNILSAVLNDLREDKFTYQLRPLKESISLDSFIKNSRGQVSSISLVFDNLLDSELLEPTTLTIKAKSRKEFPQNIVDKIVKTSTSGSMKHLNKLLPENIQDIDIKNAIVELKVPNRSKIKVNITDNINMSHSFSLPTESKDLDKFGHPSYNYLKGISQSSMK